MIDQRLAQCKPDTDHTPAGLSHSIACIVLGRLVSKSCMSGIAMDCPGITHEISYT